MQSTTGCRINVSSQFHPSDVEREISLQGPKDAILRARKAIEDKVEASVCFSSSPSPRFLPHSSHDSSIFPIHMNAGPPSPYSKSILQYSISYTFSPLVYNDPWQWCEVFSLHGE